LLAGKGALHSIIIMLQTLSLCMFIHTHTPNPCRSFILGLLLRDIGFFRFSVLSATEMRRALCAAIMQAPMMFFMTENLGPLTGVFTRDLNVVCEERAYNLHLPCVCMIQRPTVRCFSVTDIFVAVADAIHMGTIYLMILLTTMGLIIAQIPYFAIACFILLAASVFIQMKYAKKVEAAKKEFQKSNDEVFHTLSDSLEGVKVLRTADQTIWSIDLLTEAFKNSRVCTVANEECTLWLARRADAMGVALSFLTCILCIVLKLPAGPKGLAISNSLQILVFYSWMMKNVAAAIYSSGSVDRIYEYVSSIPQEVRTGDALEKQWPAKGDVEVSDMRFIAVRVCVASCALISWNGNS
jgi:ABC-type multidrug transport system fused ATPase/permease subunit